MNSTQDISIKNNVTTYFVPIYTNTIIENITTTFNVIINPPQETFTNMGNYNYPFLYFPQLFLLLLFIF